VPTEDVNADPSEPEGGPLGAEGAVQRRRRSSWRDNTTALIALIGAITGILGLVLALSQRQEETSISLATQASLSTRDEFDFLYVLRLTIANGGIRGLVLRDASLWDRDREIARETGYLPAFQSVFESSLPPSDHSEKSFPVPLAARTGTVLGVVLSPVDTQLEKLLNRNDKRLGEGNVGCSVPACLDPERRIRDITLRLDLVPGGVRKVPVEQIWSQTFSAHPGPGLGFDFFDFKIHAPASAAASLGLSVGDPAAFPGAMVRVELWRQGVPNALMSIERPVDKFVQFPLGRRLAAGSYTASFSIGGKVVLLEYFRSPCETPVDPAISHHPAHQGCGQLFVELPSSQPFGG
jgi:hypothetical protein